MHVLPESGDDGCTNGAVRLVNSTIEHEGRVEVCADGVWGTVCDLDSNDASVICTTLGYCGGKRNRVFMEKLYQLKLYNFCECLDGIKLLGNPVTCSTWSWPLPTGVAIAKQITWIERSLDILRILITKDVR